MLCKNDKCPDSRDGVTKRTKIWSFVHSLLSEKNIYRYTKVANCPVVQIVIIFQYIRPFLVKKNTKNL